MKKYLFTTLIVLGPVIGGFFIFKKKEEVKKESFVQTYNNVLAQVLSDRISGFCHKTAIAIRGTGDFSEFNFGYQADLPIEAASVIKLQTMAACYYLAEQNKFSLDDKYILSSQDRTAGSGQIKNKKNGSHFTHRELMCYMVEKSDNTATNALIRIIGREVLNQCFLDLGMKGTILNTTILNEDRKKGINNTTTAEDCVNILQAIYEKRCVSQKASEEMLKLLREQKVRNRIPRLLPKDVVVANKTGIMFNYFHDVGLMETPKGAVAASLLTYGEFTNYEQSKDFISDIARLVYDYFLGFIVFKDLQGDLS